MALQVLDDNKERVQLMCSAAVLTCVVFLLGTRPAQDGFIPTVELRAILMKEAMI